MRYFEQPSPVKTRDAVKVTTKNIKGNKNNHDQIFKRAEIRINPKTSNKIEEGSDLMGAD